MMTRALFAALVALIAASCAWGRLVPDWAIGPMKGLFFLAVVVTIVQAAMAIWRDE